VPTRNRLLVWLAGIVLVAGAVVALRATDESAPDESRQPVHVDRYAANIVVLPSAGRRPPAPDRVVVTPGAGRLRLSWADGLADGTAPANVTGYDVRWRIEGEKQSSRLVAAPDVQLTGLTDGRRYRVEVRSVDAFGQRSPATEVTAVPGREEHPEQAGLTGMFDDFADPATALETSPDSRWHASG
jgi:hypothetical protein